MDITRPAVWQLLNQYTKKEALIKHALAVEAAMRAYARKFGEDQELWGIVGLLHDFDYDAYPSPEDGGHPYKGNQILEELKYPKEIRSAIMGHANFTGVPRNTMMAKVLFAVDELCGFVMAVAYVRPEKLNGMTASSVKKKLKDKAFAAKVNREEIAEGALELGVEKDDHIQMVITALQSIASELGF